MKRNDDGYLRKKDAAEYAGVSERTLGNWMTKGVIPFRRVSARVVLFRKDEIDQALSLSSVGENQGGEQ